MKSLDDLLGRIRRGEPLPFPMGGLLSAATPVWRLGMARRMRLPRVRVDAHVVSFGNLTVGGTGKTPAVIERARIETARGKKVAVVTRGYGTKRKAVPEVAQGEKAIALGDEPGLVGLRVPEAYIIKCVDRVAGAQTAIDSWGCDTIILDDGFQYVRLERDENVLVIDAGNPFGNRRLMPRGILREPIESAVRATHVFVTRCDQAKDLDIVIEHLHRLCPHVPVRKTVHAPTSLRRLTTGEALPLETLRERPVCAVCAIGNPEAFFATIEGLGAVLKERKAYRDHAAIPRAALEGNDLVVVTEKDAVRMVDPPENVATLRVELRDFQEGGDA
ncbi:MAG TPA: tetraacyldisaccharide 4'-kinase [Candidatus Hydrogenedentes bacterium]|nr:tetraacyldisaccharide 4'-kinase [Candidatus Hydrogenedentota bacterium]